MNAIIKILIVKILLYLIYLKLIHDIINIFSPSHIITSLYFSIAIIFIFMIAVDFSMGFSSKILDIVHGKGEIIPYSENDKIITKDNLICRSRTKMTIFNSAPERFSCLYHNVESKNTGNILSLINQIPNLLTNVYITKKKDVRDKINKFNPERTLIKSIGENESFLDILTETIEIAKQNINIIVDRDIKMKDNEIVLVKKLIKGVFFLAVEELDREKAIRFEVILEESQDGLIFKKNRYGEAGKLFKMTGAA